MAFTNVLEVVAELPQAPPTQDELPHSDGVPLESERHFQQMSLLIETLKEYWKDRPEGYVGGNMFVYFNPDQLKNQDFRGPDFFAVLGVPRKERRSWVVWEERRAPDVIIELLSESTAETDRGKKKDIYQDELRVPEYFYYDPFGGELAGFGLHKGVYVPIEPDRSGQLKSDRLGLFLARREGTYHGIEAPWLRWVTPEGRLLPTEAEAAQQEAEVARQRAAAAQQEAAAAQQEAAAAQQQAAALEAQLARYRERFGELG